jgi:glucose/arabinose dehydrogenase
MGCPTYGPFEYGIPPDNPWVGGGGLPEIFASGLRNPWRFSFDGDVAYMGDVGQYEWEEIDVLAAGADFGWSDMEGFHCFDQGGCDGAAGPNGINADGYTLPIFEYGHGGGNCAVTGGYVYRSCEVPEWEGRYLFADYCSGNIRGLVWDGQSVQDLDILTDMPEYVFGSGTNAWGDVYFGTVVVDQFNTITDGRVYRVAPAG